MHSSTKNNGLYEFLLSQTAFSEFISLWKNYKMAKRKEEKPIEHKIFLLQFIEGKKVAKKGRNIISSANNFLVRSTSHKKWKEEWMKNSSMLAPVKCKPLWCVDFFISYFLLWTVSLFISLKKMGSSYADFTNKIQVQSKYIKLEPKSRVFSSPLKPTSTQMLGQIPLSLQVSGASMCSLPQIWPKPLCHPCP